MLAIGAFIAAASLWSLIRAAERPGRMANTAAASDLTDVLVLPKKTADRSRELASWHDFVERLQISKGDDQESAPLLYVRLDGVEETRRRYGSSVADHIVIATAHRLRAHLRQHDMVANFLPGELFVLLSSDVSEEDVTVVLRRLETVLATPIPFIKRRHAKLVTVTVEVTRTALTNGRLQILVADTHLVDAPLAPVDPDGSRALRDNPQNDSPGMMRDRHRGSAPRR